MKSSSQTKAAVGSLCAISPHLVFAARAAMRPDHLVALVTSSAVTERRTARVRLDPYLDVVSTLTNAQSCHPALVLVAFVPTLTAPTHAAAHKATQAMDIHAHGFPCALL